jgi:hypothetical protein
MKRPCVFHESTVRSASKDGAVRPLCDSSVLNSPAQPERQRGIGQTRRGEVDLDHRHLARRERSGRLDC